MVHKALMSRRFFLKIAGVAGLGTALTAPVNAAVDKPYLIQGGFDRGLKGAKHIGRKGTIEDVKNIVNSSRNYLREGYHGRINAFLLDSIGTVCNNLDKCTLDDSEENPVFFYNLGNLGHSFTVFGSYSRENTRKIFTDKSAIDPISVVFDLGLEFNDGFRLESINISYLDGRIAKERNIKNRVSRTIFYSYCPPVDEECLFRIGYAYHPAEQRTAPSVIGGLTQRTSDCLYVEKADGSKLGAEVHDIMAGTLFFNGDKELEDKLCLAAVRSLLAHPDIDKYVSNNEIAVMQRATDGYKR
ncbi:MAG: twin-arginine translocation signal domain-containing protein [Nanoarchaeota archaeon]